jgi:hypothetical protein
MTTALRRIPATPRASRSERFLNPGDSKMSATIGFSGAVRNSIRLPARERMTVREPGGVHFVEMEVPGIAAFESLRLPKPKCLT